MKSRFSGGKQDVFIPLGIGEYVRLAAPEPEVLRVIAEESKRKGTDKLTCRRIDQIIKAARARKAKRG